MKTELSELLKKAKQASFCSYAPYSGYKVGAAVETDVGVFCAANVENASFGLSLCAERNAAFQAVGTGGAKRIFAVAVYAEGRLPMPCGACLQVISEFAAQDTSIIVSNGKVVEQYLLSDLFKGFGGFR